MILIMVFPAAGRGGGVVVVMAGGWNIGILCRIYHTSTCKSVLNQAFTKWAHRRGRCVHQVIGQFRCKIGLVVGFPSGSRRSDSDLAPRTLLVSCGLGTARLKAS